MDLTKIRFRLKSYGFAKVEGLYPVAVIDRIASVFGTEFESKLAKGRVQNRDPGRFASKVTPSSAYAEILRSCALHAIVKSILGDDYALSHFSSHNALPGCGYQQIHADGYNLAGSDSTIIQEDSVLFVHVPLMDITEQHGPTELWPASMFGPRDQVGSLRRAAWLEQDLPSFKALASRGDIILKNYNCFHRGTANQSGVTRSILTLVFVAAEYADNFSSGRVTGADYSHLRLPYDIRANLGGEHVHRVSQYRPLKPTRQPADARAMGNLGYGMEFQQYGWLEGLLSPSQLLEGRQHIGTPHQTNWILAVVDRLVPYVRRAFRSNRFFFHGCEVLTNRPGGPACPYPTLLSGRGPFLLNRESIVNVCLPLRRSESWIRLFPGNRLLSQSLQLEPAHCEHADNVDLPAVPGSALFQSGTLFGQTLAEIETIVLTFSHIEVYPGRSGRFVVDDKTYMRLPRRLRRLIRYEHVRSTGADAGDFVYSREASLLYGIETRLQRVALAMARRLRDPFEGRPFVRLVGWMQILTAPILFSLRRSLARQSVEFHLRNR